MSKYETVELVEVDVRGLFGGLKPEVVCVFSFTTERERALRVVGGSLAVTRSGVVTTKLWLDEYACLCGSNSGLDASRRRTEVIDFSCFTLWPHSSITPRGERSS